MNGNDKLPAGRQEPIGPAPRSSESGVGPAPLPDNSPLGGSSGGSSTPPPSSPSPTPPPSGPPSGPPPPPPPQIDIRTMASDAESLKSSGGLGVEPKTFSPADLSKEPVFTSEIVSPTVAAGTAAHAGASGKKVGVVIGAIAVLALAAAVGYYFVWPLFTGSEEEQVTETTSPPPTLPTQTPPPAQTHKSFFANSPAGGTRDASLSSLTLAQLTGTLKATPTETTSTGVKEIVLTSGGKPVTSTQVLSLVLPGSGLEASMEEDITAFVYYANGKSYPGYVFKLKSDADPKEIWTDNKIETSTNLAALYPESPGAPKGTWKSGSVSGVSTRYLTYSSVGASINYGLVVSSGTGPNYLVISTSFDGFKKAVDLLK